MAARGLRRPDLGVRLRPARTPGRPRCPTPTATSRRTTTGTPTTCPTPPADAGAAQAGAGLAARPPAAVRTCPPTAPVDPPAGPARSTFASRGDGRRRLPRHLGNRTDGPWTYTAEAGKKLSDTWNTAVLEGRLRPDGARPERLPARVQGHGKAGRPRGDRPPRRDGRAARTDPHQRRAARRSSSRSPTPTAAHPATLTVRARRHASRTRVRPAAQPAAGTTCRSPPTPTAVPAAVRRTRRERASRRERPGDRHGLSGGDREGGQGLRPTAATARRSTGWSSAESSIPSGRQSGTCTSPGSTSSRPLSSAAT